jgi:hypothetical protein
VRAGDLEQYRKLAEHATTTGQQRVAVVYADIPFGIAGLATLESLFRGKSQQIVARVALPMGGKADLPGAVKTLTAAKPDIVYMVIPAQLAGSFSRPTGTAAAACPPSSPYGNAETLCQVAGEEAARGVVIAQVMPNLGNSAIPVVRRFQEHDQIRRARHPPEHLPPGSLRHHPRRPRSHPPRRPAPPAPNSSRPSTGSSYDVGGYTVTSPHPARGVELCGYQHRRAGVQADVLSIKASASARYPFIVIEGMIC